MHVAHRARHLAGGNVEDARRQRGVEVRRTTWLNLGIPALRDEGRQPAHFEFASNHHQEVGAVQLEDKARLGLDKVRILIAPGQRLDRHLVPADLAHQRGEVLGRGDDVQAGAGVSRLDACGYRQRRREPNQLLHMVNLQNTCAPWAPIENRNWIKISFAVAPSA
jgi:hypothetical protein